MGSTISLNRNRDRGQTLVIVLIIMFVLITLGFVVMLVLSREITATGIARERNIADDLSQAGVRYAYSQLRFAEEGADWRPEPPQPVPADVNPNLPPGLGPNSDPENPAATNPDPDYFWLRRQGVPGNADPNDRGGPDGLGCFTRLNYDTGRTLVRVLYAPSGSNLVLPNATIDPNKSKLRSYTIVQAIGRPGAFNSLDPTSVRQPDPQTIAKLPLLCRSALLNPATTSPTKEQRGQAAQIGNPHDFGSNFMGNPVRVKRMFGGTVINGPGGMRTLGAPIYVNGDLEIFGNVADPQGQSGLEVFSTTTLATNSARPET